MMIDDLASYPDMRPTGLEWMPELPATWELHRAKYSFREVDARSVTGEEELLSVSHKTGVTPRSEKNVTMFMAESNVGHKLCRPGDIAVNTMWAWMAALGVSRHIGLVSPSYGVYRPRPTSQFEPRYLDYLLRTEAYRAEYVRRSRGITTSRLRLYPPDFLRIPLVQPPRDEQRLIVRFLDWHGAQTAKLIRAKRRTIALLDEQKRSIVHHAMSSGLDPHAVLRPSGSYWLGPLPSQWTVKRLRNVAELRVSNVDKNSFEDEIPVRLCNYVDVYKNEVIHSELSFMTATASSVEIEHFRLQIGDVIITKDSEDWRDIGIPALVATEADDLVCGYHLGLLRPDASEIDSAFLYWRLLSPDVQWQLSVAANGITRYGLSHGSIKGLVLSLPELQEQQAIAAHLDAATANIRAAERVVQAEISLVQELRTRLIAEVVTGKLDVLEAAAALPEHVVNPEGVEQVGDPELLEDAVGDDFASEEAAA